ncbi:MAG: branched-chain amino acid ABC transporter permease [Chloroflexi bacterium]|nr:branched-chain amino acid ABC transporter permease [Chloroflexota bacterium]MCI0842639.1 branched-chain amino acid ABC transporter permease [Chloroflexota bacterium]
MSTYADRLRGNLRVFNEFVAGPGLWILITLLFTYAALFETQLFVIGLIVGSVLALGSIGLTLIYGVLRFGNFAHGDLMMMGAYVTFFLLNGTLLGQRRDTNIGVGLNDLPAGTERLGDLTFGYSFLIAVALSAVVLAVVCIGLDRLVYRPLRRRGSAIVTFAIASLGIAFSVRALLLIIWGPDPRTYVSGIHKAQHYPFDVVLKTDQVFIMVVAIVMAGLVYLLLFRTKLGKAMRAYSDNPDLALVSGINTDRVIFWTWVIGGSLMAIAGSLLALQANLKPELGFQLLLPLFAGAILGGLGKPQGALIGALVVGVAQEVSVAYISAGYKPAVAFLILILILLIRPRGLFGDAN